MFVLDSTIKIGDYTFKQVHYVQIVKSVDLLSDTAIIKLPMSAVFGSKEAGFEKKPLENEIKAGDPVSITLAYKDVHEKEEFTGFVKYVNPNVPTLTIECEDVVYHIRKKRINKNFGATTLKDVLTEIVAGTGVSLSGEVPDVNFDRFILKDVNGAKALQKIKEEYGLYIFIDDNGDLYAGLKQVKNFGASVKYNLNKNIVTHDLKYRRAEDVSIYVKVIGVQKDNKKVEVLVGDQEGEQRTLYKYNISNTSQLKKIGEAELTNLKYTGYEGTVTGFLVPFANRGMSAEIVDNSFEARKGKYFITKVTITYGTGGARRVSELGTKL